MGPCSAEPTSNNVVGGTGFGQEKMPNSLRRLWCWKALQNQEETVRVLVWEGHTTAPHLYLGSVHETQLHATPSLRFVSNIPAGDIWLLSSVFTSIEQNLPQEIWFLKDWAPDLRGCLLCDTWRYICDIHRSELWHIWTWQVKEEGSYTLGEFSAPPSQLLWGNTSGCTFQLHKQSLHLSSGDLDQRVFYSTIRVLLRDSPLARRRFLLETRLPLCHLW